MENGCHSSPPTDSHGKHYMHGAVLHFNQMMVEHHDVPALVTWLKCRGIQWTQASKRRSEVITKVNHILR